MSIVRSKNLVTDSKPPFFMNIIHKDFDDCLINSNPLVRNLCNDEFSCYLIQMSKIPGIFPVNYFQKYALE